MNLAGQKGTWLQPLVAAVNCTLWVVYALFKKTAIFPWRWPTRPAFFSAWPPLPPAFNAQPLRFDTAACGRLNDCRTPYKNPTEYIL